ncbi:MAG TPA: toll/interleukin-1 receptor domain-containing protein [Rhodanobacteraceae bacterium]|nr:toll/interleukin-1 receptor domain-containing protein [Rhodanobacteraceae bacterium]
MPDPSVARFTYRAFISYSHRDKAWADWLHRALETYRVPSRLVGTKTAHGVIPRRLIPVFRDRDELASADSLAEKVNAALAQSENLIVMCSPASAASRWVNEEVLAYKRLSRGERIFCLIVGGEPNASDIPGREAEECFCPALRFKLDANGQPTTERTEPIAADARPGKDGKPNAKLRLIAGMLDVGFDALKQREQRRQVQRMTAIAGIALVVMAVTIVLAIFALVSRHRAVVAQHEAVVAKQAAVRRQKQAEGLVGFMLGDLNDKLDQVHRLDIMQAVDDKAMAYFESLPVADATDSALAMRVTALEKIGSVRLDQGRTQAALAPYLTASQLAAELVRRAPGNADRQAAYGNSLKWVGQAHLYEGDMAHALRDFQAASVALQKATAAKPNDGELAFDLAAAHHDSGYVLDHRGDFAAAKTQYEAALNIYTRWRAREPTKTRWQTYVGIQYDSLGKLALERGKLDEALIDYFADQRIKAAIAQREPGDHQAQQFLLVSNAILGRTLGWCGDLDGALHFTRDAVDSAKKLMDFDPADSAWRDYFGLYSQQLGGWSRQAGQLDVAAKADADAMRVLSALTEKDPTSSDWPPDLAQAQLELARLQLARNDMVAADRSAKAALTIITKLRAKIPDDRGLILLDAQSNSLVARIAAQRRDDTVARQHWTRAQKLLVPTLQAGNDPTFLAAYAEALLELGQMDRARPVIDRLNAMGYRTPDFMAVLASRQIGYPTNAAFQQRLAQIMSSNPADTRRPPGSQHLAGDAH